MDDVLTVTSFTTFYSRQQSVPVIALADAAGCISLYSIGNDQRSFSVRTSRLFFICTSV